MICLMRSLWSIWRTRRAFRRLERSLDGLSEMLERAIRQKEQEVVQFDTDVDAALEARHAWIKATNQPLS